MRQEEARIRYMTYTNGTDLRLPQDAANVIAGMTGNANFPNPPVKITDLTVLLDEYRSLIKPPGDRTTQSANDKNAKKQALIDALVSVGRYAEMVAAGDLVKLQTSGYVLVARNTVTAMPSVGGVTRFKTNGHPNTLEIICQTEPNVQLYEARIFAGAATEPLAVASQSSTIRAENLPLGELLRVEVRKQNKNGYGPFSSTYKTRLPTEGEMFPVA